MHDGRKKQGLKTPSLYLISDRKKKKTNLNNIKRDDKLNRTESFDKIVYLKCHWYWGLDITHFPLALNYVSWLQTMKPDLADESLYAVSNQIQHLQGLQMNSDNFGETKRKFYTGKTHMIQFDRFFIYKTNKLNSCRIRNIYLWCLYGHDTIILKNTILIMYLKYQI